VALAHIPIIDTDTHVVEPPDLWTSHPPYHPRRFADMRKVLHDNAARICHLDDR